MKSNRKYQGWLGGCYMLPVTGMLRNVGVDSPTKPMDIGPDALA